ncbi:MAG: hypothetical protein ACXWTL_06395 [Methylobacter sp.]
MDSNERANKSNLLAKLTQLEEQVSTLSFQVESNRETISILQQSLTERELQIYELESKLIFAQKSLLTKARDKIYHCRHQLENGINETLIKPYLAKIQQQIETIHNFIEESRISINRKKRLIHEHIHTTTAIVNKCPDQARNYFEKAVLNPVHLILTDGLGLAYSNLKTAGDLIEQGFINPGKALYKEIVTAVFALPSQSQVILQVWLVDPAIQQISTVSDRGKQLFSNAIPWLKSSILQLKESLRQGRGYIAEQVKQSSFWDGKHKIEVTYQT